MPTEETQTSHEPTTANNHGAHDASLTKHYSMITIPDSLYGAVIISIIDFLLSFAIISGIGLILAILPVVNRFWNIDDKKLRGGGP